MVRVMKREPDGAPIVAAGAVVWRRVGPELEVCLVHRGRYDDWSLPKGKLDPGESLLACAAREVAEETGHHVVLGRRLPSQRYSADGRPKVVHYWAARADDAAAVREPDDEIDEVAFAPLTEAKARLTYPRDADLVNDFAADPEPTTPLVFLRHGKAVGRSPWKGTDLDRPLDPRGLRCAEWISAPLAALGVEHVISSDAVRCVDTVRPFATEARIPIDLQPLVSEEGFAASPAGLTSVVDAAMHTGPTVISTHRPVLPALYAAAGLDIDESLPPCGFVVLHHRDGRPVTWERHHP
jgi:8-oxo-dGTP diphosphatase